MPHQKASHKKVRTGCIKCKQRRIKCDESKPRCLKCIRYPSKCSFSVSTSDDRQPTPRPSSSSQAFMETVPLISSIFPQDSEFSFADFELMHQWTTSTAESLAPNKVLQQTMRDLVPRMAMKQKYLMHALLSLSALHISKLRPSESSSYLLLAGHHQSVALPLIRSALACITEESCHALYVCGHIITKYVFASPQPQDSLVFSPRTGAVAEFLPLLRGAFAVHDHSLQWLARGPLGPCLENPLDESPDLSQNPNDAHLARTLILLQASGTEDAATCCEALNLLRKLFAMAATLNQTISIKTLVYTWPAKISDRYIAVMSQRKPEALLVLAHYCIMLKMIDSFWFMKGCAARLLHQCRRDLNEEWHPYISWPLSVVGLG